MSYCIDITNWQVLSFVIGAALTALLLAIGHWFPWLKTLTRIQAYIYGTASIQAGFTVWRLLNGDWLTALGGWVIAIAGGTVVLLAYRRDCQVLTQRQARRVERRGIGDDA